MSLGFRYTTITVISSWKCLLTPSSIFCRSDTLISLFLAASRSAAFTSLLPIPCKINYHQPLIFRKNFCMIKEHTHTHTYPLVDVKETYIAWTVADYIHNFLVAKLLPQTIRSKDEKLIFRTKFMH
ncbi:hypothetical protein V8G54_018372 [Vigna mungo]|uniref:Uncharacterized protein n=1 Tax=Vigna mungo TaxID=3915 RepID=A0AAQ3RUN8_VIGMU